MSSELHAKEALSIQTKHRFYFLSLIFITLSLAIQSYSPYSVKYLHIIEFISWLFFLVSGVVGLSYVEWSAFIQNKIAYIKNYEEGIDASKKIIPHVKNGYEVNNYIAYLKAKIDENKKSFKIMEDKNITKYNIHKWGYFVGLVLLVAVRGISPIIEGNNNAMNEYGKSDINFVIIDEKNKIETQKILNDLKNNDDDIIKLIKGLDEKYTIYIDDSVIEEK